MLWIDGLLALLLVIALYTDLRWRKIYNVVLYPVALGALGLHLWIDGWGGLCFWGQGLLLGLALLLVPFLLGGMGGGDVKLLAVVGALKGALFVWYSFLYTALLGGVMALVVLIWNKQARGTLRRLGLGLKVFYLSSGRIWQGTTLDNPQETPLLPYGLAIVGGTLITYWVV